MLPKDMRDSIEIDGIRLGPGTDLAALLRRQLKHGSVWNEVGDPGPEEGLWRVFDAADGTAVEKRLLHTVMELLTDPDVEIRSGAVGLAQDYAEKLDPTDLLQILEKNPLLFEGVKPVGSRADGPDLAWGILHALTANTGRDPKVLARLKKAAFDVDNGFSVLGGLAADDPQWVVAQAPAVIGDDSEKARIILANLPTPEIRERFIRTISGQDVTFKHALAGVVGEEIKNLAERKRLTAILA
jgi:hypothetical protein